MRDETKTWIKSWGWSDPRYDCQLYAFGDKLPCAAVISRAGPGNAGFQVTTGADWARINGIQVVDDGKLTIHWMRGRVHRQTVLESGPLYDALRRSEGSSAETQSQPDHALLDAFFAEQGK
jgi:hypothetical protein